MTPFHLAMPEAFEAWARNFNGVLVAELRPDGRGIVVAHAGHGNWYASQWVCAYVVTDLDDGPADLHEHYATAPCPGGVKFAYPQDGAGVLGFLRAHDSAHAIEQARREAHAFADWLAAEREARP